MEKSYNLQFYSDNLSQILLKSIQTSDFVMKAAMNASIAGIPWKDMQLNNLEFVDDIVLLVVRMECLQKINK